MYCSKYVYWELLFFALNISFGQIVCEDSLSHSKYLVENIDTWNYLLTINYHLL